jgi:hypothetical protein
MIGMAEELTDTPVRGPGPRPANPVDTGPAA